MLSLGMPRNYRLVGIAPLPLAYAAGSSAYQLAFLTPGMSPADAISRNWIRLRPNWRMYPLGRPVMVQRLCLRM